MSDPDSVVKAEDVDEKMTDGEKYRDIGRAEDYFREKLGIERTAYIVLGGVYGHLAYNPAVDMQVEPEEYIINEYREAEKMLSREFNSLSMTDIYNDEFIQEQIANYIEEKVMSEKNDAFKSLRWKIDGGLQHIATSDDDPVSSSQDAVDNPIVADGGLEARDEEEEVDKKDGEQDSYNIYFQFIYEGLEVSAKQKNDVLVQRVLQHIPESRSHRYEDSFEDLLRKSIIDERSTIAARAANEVDKRTKDSKDMSKRDKIKVAVEGGIVTEAVKISIEHLYNYGTGFMNDILENFDAQTVTKIFQEIGTLICENMDLIISALPF